MRDAKDEADQGDEKRVAPVEVVECLIATDYVRAARGWYVTGVLARANVTTAL
jgi:hypothetical protein